MKKMITLFLLMFSLTIINAQTRVDPTNDLTIHQGSCAPLGGNPDEKFLVLSNTSACGGGCYDDILIKFDLSLFTDTVASATLNLFHIWQNPPGGDTEGKVYAISESWDENTWDNSIDISNEPTVYTSFTVIDDIPQGEDGKWFDIDITDLVNDWIEGNIANKGLVILADNGSKPAIFSSKEDTVAYRPYLELDTIEKIDTTSIESVDFVIGLSLYPIPTSNKATIELNLVKTHKISISIYNIQGQKIEDIYNNKNLKGEVKIPFSTKHLQKGIYFVTINIDNQKITKKIIKK